MQHNNTIVAQLLGRMSTISRSRCKVCGFTFDFLIFPFSAFHLHPILLIIVVVFGSFGLPNSNYYFIRLELSILFFNHPAICFQDQDQFKAKQQYYGVIKLYNCFCLHLKSHLLYPIIIIIIQSRYCVDIFPINIVYQWKIKIIDK